MLVLSALNDICAGVLASAAAAVSASAAGVGMMTTGGGGDAMIGTSAALLAATKSAETQPLPPGAVGTATTHQLPSALRPMISPSAPKGATPSTGKLVPGPERTLTPFGAVTRPVGTPGAGSGIAISSSRTMCTAMASSALRSSMKSPSMV
jgi:hypothetical protein